jgi:hypothetical protein
MGLICVTTANWKIVVEVGKIFEHCRNLSCHSTVILCLPYFRNKVTLNIMVENVLIFLIIFFVLKSRSATTIVVDNFHISQILVSIRNTFFSV